MITTPYRCAAASLLSVLAALPALAQPKGPMPAAPPPGRVFVTAARADTLAEPKTFVGTVVPLRKSTVGSAAPGRVEEYLVNEGDFIKKGAPIAHLRRGIIGAEKRAAEAELDVRRAALAEMENSHQDEIAQAKAMLAVADANQHFRTAKLDRARQLGGAITREALEEEISMNAQASANVTHAQAALRMLTGSSWEQKHLQAQARVAVQEAEVARLSEQFDRHTMFAPFDGWVTKEFTEMGQWLMQGDAAAEIAELGSIDVEVAVLEDYVTRLHTGVIGNVEVNALRGQQFTGKVSAINPQADARARTFPVKVRVENIIDERGPLLKAGMFARVTLPVGDSKRLPLVPKDAISIGGRSPVVFVVSTTGGKSTVRPVPVTLGVATGQWISVGDGEIKEGEIVVVEGNERLRPGQEVRPEKIEVSYP
jgi:HlyD family secretion protein